MVSIKCYNSACNKITGKIEKRKYIIIIYFLYVITIVMMMFLRSVTFYFPTSL